MNGTNQSRTSVVAFLCLLMILLFFLAAMIVPYILALLTAITISLLQVWPMVGHRLEMKIKNNSEASESNLVLVEKI